MATKVKKQEIVQELEGLFASAKVAVVADVTGLTVAELTKFRRQLDAGQSKCRIAKNTLIKIATKKGQFAPIETLTKGPSAIVVGYDDPIQPVKTAVDYFKELKKGSIRGGILDGEIISSNDVNKLAALPSKEILLAGIMGSLDSGASGVVGAISGLLRDITYLIEEVAKKNNKA
jgi:large subunit ribosomal protein L10